MAIRDPVPLIRTLAGSGLDRAALLENSFSNWFDKATAHKGSPIFGRAFGSFGPRQGDWRPLLIFNGTSAITGRRVLTSHISAHHSVQINDVEKQFRLFQDAYDVRELYRLPFEDPAKCIKFDSNEAPAKPLNPFGERDFSLATAVTNSARFPVISPAGTVSCERPDPGFLGRIGNFFTGGNREIIDHIVDGGYFENFGATSAMNLARALETFGLAPVVLVISNNPTAGRAAENLLADACAPLPPDITDELMVGQGSSACRGTLSDARCARLLCGARSRVVLENASGARRRMQGERHIGAGLSCHRVWRTGIVGPLESGLNELVAVQGRAAVHRLPDTR